MKLLLLPLVVLVPLLVAPATAQDFGKGVEAYLRSDYAAAVREWRPLAEGGQAQAQNGLGVMYENGQGVPRDYSVAVKWYRRAAGQGYALAAVATGIYSRFPSPQMSVMGQKRSSSGDAIYVCFRGQSGRNRRKSGHFVHG